MDPTQVWHQCSSCRKPIPFAAEYYVCSVSTCNRTRTALYFCSLPCWEAHLPMMRHRDAWAEPKRAPTREAWEQQSEAEHPAAPSVPAGVSAPAAVRVPAAASPRRVVSSASEAPEADDADEVLVVVSKLKKYVRARSGMNTSDGVVGVLSDHLRRLCNEAIRNAAQDGRKTVMERDFAPLLRPGRASDD